MINEKATITITLPKRLADKLREIDRLIGSDDLGQTLAESCGWRLENLTDSKSEEIIDLIDDKRWRSRSECEKAAAIIAAELKDWPIEVEKRRGRMACARLLVRSMASPLEVLPKRRVKLR